MGSLFHCNKEEKCSFHKCSVNKFRKMKMTESPPFKIDIERTEKLRPHGKKKREARIKSVKQQPYPLVGHELSVLGKEPVWHRKSFVKNGSENVSSGRYVSERLPEKPHVPCVVADKVPSSEYEADRLSKQPKAQSAVSKKSPDLKFKRQLGGIVDVIIPRSQYKDMTGISFAGGHAGHPEHSEVGSHVQERQSNSSDISAKAKLPCVKTESISSNSLLLQKCKINEQICKKSGEDTCVGAEMGSDKENEVINIGKAKGFNYSEVRVESSVFLPSEIKSIKLAEIFPEVKRSVITDTEEFPFIPPPIIPLDNFKGKKIVQGKEHRKSKSVSSGDKALRKTKKKRKVKLADSSKYSGRPFITRESRLKFWKAMRKKVYKDKKEIASSRCQGKVCGKKSTDEVLTESGMLRKEACEHPSVERQNSASSTLPELKEVEEASEVGHSSVEPQKSASSSTLLEPEEVEEVLEIEVEQEVDHELIDLVEDEIEIIFESLGRHENPPDNSQCSHDFSYYCTRWFNYRHTYPIAGSPVLTSDTFS